MQAKDPDPFAIFHIPPPNETLEERAARKAQEAEAKRVSDEIDAQLKAEKVALRKRRRPIRVLVIGQSESGKSTLLSHFRILSLRAASQPEHTSFGVQEHRMMLRSNRRSRNEEYDVDEWIFYVVSGSRMVKPAWIAYLDKIDAVIFLAPVSGFDERLPEDRYVNRLEDSLILWKSICSSGLLVNVPMMLILNKCDILKQKLISGVSVKTYLPSYGDRPNDVNHLVKYLSLQFRAVSKRHSLRNRVISIHQTSMIDAKTTRIVHNYVLERVMVAQLMQWDLMNDRDWRATDITPIRPTSSAEPNLESQVSSTSSFDSTSLTISEYSLASSRTEDTEYGFYWRRMALSQETFGSETLDDGVF